MPRKELPTIPNLGPQTTEIRIPVSELTEGGDYIFLVYGIEGSPDQSIGMEWTKDHRNKPIFEKNKATPFPKRAAIFFDNTPYKGPGMLTPGRVAGGKFNDVLHSGIVINGTTYQYPVALRFDSHKLRWITETYLHQINRHVYEGMKSLLGNHVWVFFGHGVLGNVIPTGSGVVFCDEECALVDTQRHLTDLQSNTGKWTLSMTLQDYTSTSLAHLQLVMIMGCATGGGGSGAPSGLRDFFVAKGVPIVVTVNGVIGIGAAAWFTQDFFKGLQPVTPLNQQMSLDMLIEDIEKDIVDNYSGLGLNQEQRTDGFIYLGGTQLKPIDH